MKMSEITRKHIETIEELGFEQAFINCMEELKPNNNHIAALGFCGAAAMYGLDLYRAGQIDDETNGTVYHVDFDTEKMLYRKYVKGGGDYMRNLENNVDSWIQEEMESAGVDESTARANLSGDFMAGIEAFNANAGKIIREANTMCQVEDAIGPVDWEDEGNE